MCFESYIFISSLNCIVPRSHTFYIWAMIHARKWWLIYDKNVLYIITKVWINFIMITLVLRPRYFCYNCTSLLPTWCLIWTQPLSTCRKLPINSCRWRVTCGHEELCSLWQVPPPCEKDVVSLPSLRCKLWSIKSSRSAVMEYGSLLWKVWASKVFCLMWLSQSWIRSSLDLSSRGPWYAEQAAVMSASPGALARCLRVFFNSERHRKCCIDMFSIKLLARTILFSTTCWFNNNFHY